MGIFSSNFPQGAGGGNNRTFRVTKGGTLGNHGRIFVPFEENIPLTCGQTQTNYGPVSCSYSCYCVKTLCDSVLNHIYYVTRGSPSQQGCIFSTVTQFVSLLEIVLFKYFPPISKGQPFGSLKVSPQGAFVEKIHPCKSVRSSSTLATWLAWLEAAPARYYEPSHNWPMKNIQNGGSVFCVKSYQ